MTTWNNVAGSFLTFSWGQDINGSQIGNGTNEIYALSDPDGATGTVAVTIPRTSCKLNWLKMDYEFKLTEMDIVFNTRYNSNFASNFSYTGNQYSREGVALHELGHALGLDHENHVQALMNEAVPNSGPVGCGMEWTPFGDDRSGVRHLYPDGTTERDIAASTYKLCDTCSKSTSKLVPASTSAKQGDQVYMEYTVSNLGSYQETYNIGFYLSTDELISTSDVLIGTVTGAALSAGATGLSNRYLTIPHSVKPGKYYLGFIVDYDNVIPESNETNNNQQMPGGITIDFDAARFLPAVIMPLLF
jgi:hypothetical protein